MNEPGGLDDLGAAGRAAWTRRVEESVREVLTINRGVICLLKQDTVAASEVVPLMTRPRRKAEVEA